MNHIGQQFGNYRLVRLLGTGGFAKVYLGEHIHLGTQAAIKILQESLEATKEQEFKNEAWMLAQLRHPNIVRLLDFDIQNGIPFLVMDVAPNGTLRKRHPYGTQVPLTAIVSYVKHIAQALQAAHNKKVIHRDIKPANMLIGPNNEIWLSDFGIAVIAHSTQSLITQNAGGSWLYSAPEQFDGRALPASDQYALGIVVYEWLSGSTPFHGDIPQLYHHHHWTSPPSLQTQVPTISSTVEQVVFKTLEKDPRHRFPGIQDFATALEQACYPQQRIHLEVSPDVPKITLPLGERRREILATKLDNIDTCLQKSTPLTRTLIAETTLLIKDISSEPHPFNPLYSKPDIINLTNRYLQQLKHALTQQPHCTSSIAEALTEMLDPNIENEVLASQNPGNIHVARLETIETLAQATYNTVINGNYESRWLEALKLNLHSCIYAPDNQMPASKRLNVAKLYVMTLSEMAKKLQNEEETRYHLTHFYRYLSHIDTFDSQRWIWRHLETLSDILNSL